MDPNDSQSDQESQIVKKNKRKAEQRYRKSKVTGLP